MEFAVLGLKTFFSQKSNKEWAVLHIAFQDKDYKIGYAVGTLIVDSSVLKGNFVEGCNVRIDRSPDGKRVLAITVI